MHCAATAGLPWIALRPCGFVFRNLEGTIRCHQRNQSHGQSAVAPDAKRVVCPQRRRHPWTGAYCSVALSKVMGDERVPLRQIVVLAAGHVVRFLVHFPSHATSAHALLLRSGDACSEGSADVPLDALLAMKSTCKFITSTVTPSLPQLLPKVTSNKSYQLRIFSLFWPAPSCRP